MVLLYTTYVRDSVVFSAQDCNCKTKLRQFLCWSAAFGHILMFDSAIMPPAKQ